MPAIQIELAKKDTKMKRIHFFQAILASLMMAANANADVCGRASNLELSDYRFEFSVAGDPAFTYALLSSQADAEVEVSIRVDGLDCGADSVATSDNNKRVLCAIPRGSDQHIADVNVAPTGALLSLEYCIRGKGAVSELEVAN